MSVGWECWVDSKRYQSTLWFNKNNLTYKEACFETAKDIRARTNKTLVLPLSGGADSQIVYNIFKELGIEFKTIHQRYWKDSIFINEVESKLLDHDTVDEYQDINVDEFQNSDWYKNVINHCPLIWMGCLVSYSTTKMDQENDLLISGAGALILEWGSIADLEKNKPNLYGIGDMVLAGVTHRGYNFIHFFNDNAIIHYSRFRNMPRHVMGLDKHYFLRYHFPDWEIVEKQDHWQMPYFKTFRNEANNITMGYIANHTFPYYGELQNNLDVFFEYMDSGHPMTAVGEWDRSRCEGLNDVSILSDTTEYYAAATIQSKNL